MLSNGFPKEIEVVAYSGYKANERPLHFLIDGNRLEAEKIIDRWYGEENDYFKVLANDGRIYMVRRHRFEDRWFLEKVIEKIGEP